MPLDGFTPDQMKLLSVDELRIIAWRKKFLDNARPAQVPPVGDWSVFGFVGGRGSGKSFAGTNWVAFEALTRPGIIGHIIAPTWSDAQFVCFEGPAGLINQIPPELIKDYNRSDLVLTFTNGSMLRAFSAEKPDRLRGPQCHVALCDELGAWQRAQDTWDMMTMGLRLGTQTKVMFATTPKPTELMINLLKRAEKDKSVVIHRGTSYDNKQNLAPSFFAELERYSGTKIFQQEVMGEMLDPEESGIIKRSWIRVWPASKNLPKFEHVLLSLDTAFTEATLDNKSGDADYTACSCWGVFNNPETKRLEVILLDAWQDRLGLPDLVARTKLELTYHYGEIDKPLFTPLHGPARIEGQGRKVDTIVIEDIGAGKSLRQYLSQAGIPALAYNPGRADKLARLHLASPFFKLGQVWMPESANANRSGQLRDWCEDMVAQLCAFPNVKHDDLMDTATQALRTLSDMQLLRSTKPQEVFVDQLRSTHRPKVPVYG